MYNSRMFKPIRWNTFIRDFVVIQIGFVLFGLAITLLIQANLGTGPWVILQVALSDFTGLSVGNMIVFMGFLILIAVLLLKVAIGWGTLGNILFIGPWVDLWLEFVPSVNDRLLLQIIMLVAAAPVMGIASAIYIGVNAGAGPRDSLMLGVERVSGWSLRVARGVIEITVVIVGWLLGGPVGVGTIVFALLIGPSVQWAFKLFKVESNSKKG